MFGILRKLAVKSASTISKEPSFLHRLGCYDGPLHVRPDVPNCARCVRLPDGRFHVFEKGVFPPLLAGSNHILINRSLRKVLQAACGDCIEIASAEVVEMPSGKSVAMYSEVKPREEITPAKLKEVDATGKRIWHFRKSYLFVSRAVAQEIQRAGIPSLRFNPGFTEFGSLVGAT